MIANNLNKNKYEISVATIGKNGIWIFNDSQSLRYSTKKALEHIRHSRNHIVFVALHGTFGEDGRIQTLLENNGLSYTGSGPKASMLAMDKAASGAILERTGLRVPRFVRLQKTDGLEMLYGLRFPVVVKPCNGGSSVGVSVAKSPSQAFVAARKIIKSGDDVIVQEQIAGRELTCGILDDGRGIPRALPPTEIIPKRGALFDYRAKYVPGASVEITPAKIPEDMTALVQRSALAAHIALGCSGMSRSDFMLQGKNLFILEVNTIPGMTATSLLPQQASAAGIPFSMMLDRIVNSALRKGRKNE